MIHNNLWINIKTLVIEDDIDSMCSILKSFCNFKFHISQISLVIQLKTKKI